MEWKNFLFNSNLQILQRYSYKIIMGAGSRKLFMYSFHLGGERVA